jgi:hypothetical protein
MNCDTCKAKIPTLRTRLSRVNSELHQLGLTYQENMGDAFRRIDSALLRHGFADTNFTEVNADIDAASFHTCVSSDTASWLHVTWHRMESGRYEVVAYVNQMKHAIKIFEVEESSTENTWYMIQVYFRGIEVDKFLAPTMAEAREKFYQAGYRQHGLTR